MAESAVSAGCARSSFSAAIARKRAFDPVGVDFDVVVEKQDRLIAQEQIRPQLHEASNGGRFGSRLMNGDVGLRMDARLVIVVEENVIAARLFKVGCVKPLAALDEDKDVALRVSRFAFDAQSPIGIEAVLTRSQFLPIERRPHLALAERAVEDPEGRLLERAGLHAARDVADEFNIDIRPRTPAGLQSALEKVQERMGMALGPIRVLRHVPAMVEFGGRGGGVGLGAGEVELEQASVRVFRDVRVGAEGSWDRRRRSGR